MPLTIIDNIKIGGPTFDENTQRYTFDLKSNDDVMTFNSKLVYRLSVNDCSQLISIPEKDELKLFHGIYTDLKKIFLENHVKWFENKFSESELDILFRSFLVPNISENRIDIQVEVTPELLDDLRSSNGNNEFVLGNPTFSFNRLVLNLEEEKMNCIVSINRFNCDSHNSNDLTLGKNQDNKASLSEDEQIIQNQSIHGDCLEEVTFDGQELEEVDMNFNNEDYFVIYKFLTRQINDSLHKELNSVLKEKEINMKTIDLGEIIDEIDYDSEGTDSESYDSDLNNYL
tara:strand:- start:159 stop:1016 length:858 start_codon:yes stop_codon:yes gene_type:complete